MANITNLSIPYPDFKLHEVIDPEQFDFNNGSIVDKMNAVLLVLNQITESVANGGSGADRISLSPILPFTSNKLQAFLLELISRLVSTSAESGSSLIGTASIAGVSGTKISAQLVSLKALIDAEKARITLNTKDITDLKARAHALEINEVYTRDEIDSMVLGNYMMSNYNNHSVISLPATDVAINIPEYVEGRDSISIYVGGVYQTIGVDVDIVLVNSVPHIRNLQGVWDASTIFDFAVVKSIKIPTLSEEELMDAGEYAFAQAEYVEAKKPIIDEFLSGQEGLQTQLNDLVLQSGTDIAEVVQARGGEVTLNARLTKTTALLAEKVGGQVKLKPEEFSDEAMALVTGNGTVNVLSIPQNGSVTPEKTVFFDITKSKNLFDKSKATIGRYLNTDGTYIDNGALSTTDFIPVTVGSAYTMTRMRIIAFYNSSKTFLANTYFSDGTTKIPYTATAPSGSAFMRVVFQTANIDTLQIELGSVESAYVAFFESSLIKSSLIPPTPIPPVAGSNLFNKTTVANDTYIDHTTGVATAGAGFKASDFISVDSSTQYSILLVRHYAFYNANKTFISGKPDNSKEFNKTITIPSTAKYIRFSWYPTSDPVSADTQQFIKGVFDYPLAVLPPKIDAVVGKEVNVYFQNIFSDIAKNYSIDVVCEVGTHQNERWTVAPTVAGTYPIQVTFYNGIQPVAHAVSSVVVKVANAGNGVVKKSLFIGDSTTDNGTVTAELVNLFNTDVMDLTLLGTRGTAPNLHEGRSGWSTQTYLTTANPFLNSGAFDFSNYMTTQGYASVDYVFIALGINDIFEYTDDTTLNTAITAILGRFDTMINSIKAYNSAIKIGLFVTIPPSYNQDSFGASYTSYQPLWRYKRNHFLFIKALIEKYKSRTTDNIYLVPVCSNLDTENNFPTVTVNANSRNTKQIARQSNGVHPATEGYNQMADSVFYWIKGFEA